SPQPQGGRGAGSVDAVPPATPFLISGHGFLFPPGQRYGLMRRFADESNDGGPPGRAGGGWRRRVEPEHVLEGDRGTAGRGGGVGADVIGGVTRPAPLTLYHPDAPGMADP